MRDLIQLNLNALRVAESAARNRSFVRAAEEQRLTPSAVSQRIKALEAQLRFPLFKRKNNAIVLTHEGEAFIARVREGLSKITEARMMVKDPKRETTLYLCALPTFIMRWLIQRLPDFQRRHPEITLNISQSYATPDLDRADFDLGIFYGDGDFGRLEAELLFKEDLTPVCRPSAITEIGKDLLSLKVRDLRHFTLLHSATCTLNWAAWLEHAGEPQVIEEARPMYFDSCMLTFEAARNGLGFACANRAYVAEDIVYGRLVAPFTVLQPNRNGWYVLRSMRRSQSKPMEIFRDWIRDQADLSLEVVDMLSQDVIASK
ncbi:MAG: LysR substrate-binding domain-containing protein [Hyphomicrobiaceae bacterium]